MAELRLNISETYKIFLWLNMKTGTSHMSTILNNFDFKPYLIDGKEKTLLGNKILQDHECGLFEGHENYELLATIRNPYSRMFSIYSVNKKNANPFEFNEFLEKYFQQSHGFDTCAKLNRIPEYIVRMENMYEDYSKIPFITNSEIFKSGRLKEMVTKKINSNPMEYNWKEFYDQNSADLVYYNNVNYFEQYKYEKNSWKN